jgi:two-component SAPR family response regulator
VATAGLLADAALAAGKPDLAATAAERGLAVDRYSDALWRQLERAHQAAGDVAAAERARRAYATVRMELGVD